MSGRAFGDLVQTAVVLADADGIAGVTLRTVAHHGGVALPEVRRALRNRDTLLAAMVQRVLSPPHRTGVPDRAAAMPRGARASESPARTLTRLAEDEWAAYREHPWLVSVLASSRPPLVPVVLEAARASTEAFMALGLDPPSALGRYIALSGYVQGMALLLLAERDEVTYSGTVYGAWWAQEARRLDRTGLRRRHPWLEAANGGNVPDAFDTDVDTWFRDGLGRVLAGLMGRTDGEVS